MSEPSSFLSSPALKVLSSEIALWHASRHMQHPVVMPAVVVLRLLFVFYSSKSSNTTAFRNALSQVSKFCIHKLT